MIDGRDAEIAELKRLLDTAGVVEIGARNPNVASYCDHWERRAEKAEAALSEREGELAEWRDIKEQMRCLTIYSKRDLQVKVAMQIRLREAAEKEIARLRVRLFANRQVDGLSHSTACSIWGDDGTGKTSEGFKEPLPCNCGCLINYERHKAASAYARLEAALSPSQESSAQETTSGETR